MTATQGKSSHRDRDKHNFVRCPSEGQKGRIPDFVSEGQNRDKKGVLPILSLSGTKRENSRFCPRDRQTYYYYIMGKGFVPALSQSRNNKLTLSPQEEVQKCQEK
jgi:hypothetical protein